MPDNKLIKATKAGSSPDLIQALLEQGVDINSTDQDGNTALTWAAYRGHTEIFQQLMAARADVDQVNDHGVTPLMRAAQQGHLEIVKELMKAGAVVNHVSQIGDTALIKAAKNGHAEIVRVLVAAGAEINHFGEVHATALVCAAHEGHKDVIKAILGDGLFNLSSTDEEFQQSLNRINQITAALNNGKFNSDRKIIRWYFTKFLKESIEQMSLAGRGGQVHKKLTLLKDNLNIIQPNEEEKKSGKQKSAMKALLAMIESVKPTIALDKDEDSQTLILAVNAILSSADLSNPSIDVAINTLLDAKILPNGKAQSELLNHLKQLGPIKFESLKTKLKDIALAAGGAGVRQGVQGKLVAMFSDNKASYDQNPYLFILRTGQSKFEQKDTTSFNALKSQFKPSKPGFFSRGFKADSGTSGNNNEPLPAHRNKFGKEDL